MERLTRSYWVESPRSSSSEKKDRKLSKDDEKDVTILREHLETAKGLLAKYNESIELPVDLAYEDSHGGRLDNDVDSEPDGGPALDVGVKTDQEVL